MKKLFHLIIYIIVWLVPASIQAQDSGSLRQAYTQAENAYQIGRLDQALDLLQENFNSFRGNLRQSACRLMSLCYLAQDDVEQSEKYAMLLLKENPYYSSVQDPIRFEEIVTRLRGGNIATITTASNQKESLDEAPVPVTLITEDMIKISGARNLKELLIDYVPGMTAIESNEEMNIALRGVYSAGQEKLLFLLNGHRLNSYSTNVACPDFSMSLEKIKQVEVLRGPASSLYGGVALTGVVNIITKQGPDINGVEIKGGVGNYGQIKGDFLFGNHFMDFDIMAWANVYQSTGEKIHYDKSSQPYPIYPIDGDIAIGGYNKKPTYDFGVSFSWKGLQVLFNSHFSKMQSPYSMSVMFTPYTYDKYNSFSGNKPGYGVGSMHGEISYTKDLSNFNFKAAVSIDHEDQQRYQIIGDTIPDIGFNIFIPNGSTDTIMAFNGFFQNHEWHSNTVGTNVQGTYQYQMGQHEGYVMLGGHLYKTKLTDSQYMEGDEFSRVLKVFDESKNLALGSEWSADGYLQVKHKWRKSFILNAGLRYDMKKRNDDRIINVFSPRIALIYSLYNWNFKASYAKSFVDAPYYYRNTTLDIRGSGDLEPEYMDSWQFSCTNSRLANGLSLDLNMYYNYARNFVYNDQIVGRYINAGFLKSAGCDLSLTYSYKRLLATGNLSLQRVLSSDMYPVSGHQVYSVPNIQSNIILGYKLTDAFRMHLNTICTSKQISEAIVQGWDHQYEDIPARVIFNTGVSYELKPMTLELEVHNLLNKKYYQGGNSNAPIRQQGLWFMFNAGIKL